MPSKKKQLLLLNAKFETRLTFAFVSEQLHTLIEIMSKKNTGVCIYRILPGKRSWAIFHNSLFFTILGAYHV